MTRDPYWDQDSDYPLEDWRYQVAKNEETAQGLKADGNQLSATFVPLGAIEKRINHLALEGDNS